MLMNVTKTRPKFLNLLKIRLPITGIASIAHRISGVILFLSIPFSIYLFQLSLSSEQGFQQALGYLTSSWSLIFIIPMAWAFFHHLFAGFRFLLIDLDIGISLKSARISAYLVIYLAIAATILLGVTLL